MKGTLVMKIRAIVERIKRRYLTLPTSDRAVIAAVIVSLASLIVSIYGPIRNHFSVASVHGALGYAANICLKGYKSETPRLSFTVPVCLWNDGGKDALIEDMRLELEIKLRDPCDTSEVIPRNCKEPSKYAECLCCLLKQIKQCNGSNKYSIKLRPLNLEEMKRVYSSIKRQPWALSYEIDSSQRYVEKESITPIRLKPDEISVERILFAPLERINPIDHALKLIVNHAKPDRGDYLYVTLGRYFDAFQVRLAVKVNYLDDWLIIGEELNLVGDLAHQNDYHQLREPNSPDFATLIHSKIQKEKMFWIRAKGVFWWMIAVLILTVMVVVFIMGPYKPSSETATEENGSGTDNDTIPSATEEKSNEKSDDTISSVTEEKSSETGDDSLPSVTKEIPDEEEGNGFEADPRSEEANENTDDEDTHHQAVT